MTALQGVQLHLVETYEDVAACLTWLAGLTTDRIAFDTEGTGLSPEVDQVRLIQFGDEHDGWVIPVDTWLGLAHEVIDRWVRGGGRFVAHNARYDIAMLRNHGVNIPVHLIDDSMIAAHVVNPTVSVGLKQQAAKHIDKRAASMQAELDRVMSASGYGWADIPISATGTYSPYVWYAALDPIITMRLWNHHAPTVMREAPRAYDLELAIGWLADRMERRGVLVDREYTTEQQAYCNQLITETSEQARAQFGVSLSSASQIIDVLQRDKVPLWHRTKGGAWSLNAEALDGLNHPLITLLQRYKRVEKIESTYLQRFLEYSEHDGRLHPNINTLGFFEGKASGFGVKTSRMSASNPNLQQLTRADENDALSMIARGCIVADPGHTLIMWDMDQIELRILAHISQDPGLIEAFKIDQDFFVTLMRKIYKDDTLTKKSPQRPPVKSYVYATNYGAGNDKLATTTKRPLAEIEEIDREFKREFAGVPKFQRDVQDEAARRYREEGQAYVREPLTNRKLIATDPTTLYPLVNYKIQSMAAVIMKTKALEIDAAGLGDYLSLFVHDEDILCVPDDMVDDANATMRDIMNDDTIMSVPMTSGGATAKRWSEKHDI